MILNPILNNDGAAIERTAAPHVLFHNGKYYHTYLLGDAICVAECPSLAGFCGEERIEHTVSEDSALEKCYAPELYWIDGDFYIYASPARKGSGVHFVCVYKSLDGTPTGRYETLGAVEGIGEKCSMDATVFSFKGERYMVFSTRTALYIAKMKSPTALAGAPVAIKVPEYAWERKTSDTLAGPAVIFDRETPVLVYSASDAASDDSCLGMLRMEGSDPLSPIAWRPHKAPILEKEAGAFGPGHCSFTEHEGQLACVYHAALEAESGDSGRSVFVKRAYFENGILKFEDINAKKRMKKEDFFERMNMNTYVGQNAQIYGVEEHRLVGGRGDGMRLLEVRNGKGLCFTVSLDRAADISRLSVMGVNFGYFSPCGYVHPSYYDEKGAGFLKSFTAGFLTTCGLTNVGSPCEDGGESLGLHGTIANTPADSYSVSYKEGEMIVKATVPDTHFFGRKLVLIRTFTVSLTENKLTVHDAVMNAGNAEVPFQMLYHYNVGYPLLCEKTELKIPAVKVTPRNEHAAEDIENCLRMETPTAGYEERCYYHEMQGTARVEVRNPAIGRGLIMEYDTGSLPCFTEWKMMGENEYVLGIEPANAYPDGRDVMREKGMLRFIAPGEIKEHEVRFTFE